MRTMIKNQYVTNDEIKEIKKFYKELKKIYSLHYGGNRKIENTAICSFEYFGKDPTKDEVIISCSIFKMHSMYRNINKYLDGLQKIIEYICDSSYDINAHMIVYYDHSVEEDEKFIKLKKIMVEKRKRKFNYVNIIVSLS